MTTTDIGNELYSLVNTTRLAIFVQGELAQLTYNAFGIATRQIEASQDDSFDVTFPIGWTAGNQPIAHTRQYTKQELLERYRYLGLNLLPVNAIFSLVTLIESMMNDVIRTVVRKYPHKIGSKKEIPLGIILGAPSIEVIHEYAIDNLLNDLTYKSPIEFAKAVEGLIDIKLLESGAFHKFVELKATRDVYMHNRGIANDTYRRKAGLNSREPGNNYLSVDVNYFLSSLEQCIQFTDWLELQLSEKWHSSEREAKENRADGGATNEPSIGSDAVSDDLRSLAARVSKSS